MIHFHDLGKLPAHVAYDCIQYVAKHMRAQDAQEIAAAHGLTPHEALSWAVHISTHGWVITDADDMPIAMFGAAPTDDTQPGSAAMWMLGTDGVRKNAGEVARNTRRYLDEMHRTYPKLWNYVDARNITSLRWLEWAGCRIVGHEPEFGVERRPFHLVMRESHHV